MRYIPGDYSVDGGMYHFVKCMETGWYYAKVDGRIDFSNAYAGLNELLRERHPGTTKTSGKPRGFSVKSKIRILNVLLSVWETRGYGNDNFTLPHHIPELTPAQLAIAGPQPRVYTPGLVFAPANSSPPPARGKRARDSGDGAGASAPSSSSSKRARTSADGAGASAPSSSKRARVAEPKLKTRAASRGARASPAADVSFSIEHMQAARRARKSKPAAEQASRGRKLTPAQRLLGPKNKKAKTPASARAQPSTGGRARVGKKAKLDVVRAAGGYGAPRSKARSAAGGSGGSGGGYGREQGPGEERDLRDMGILFRADFTEEQFVRLAMNPAGVRRSVDKIIDKQQLDRGYSRETLVKARSWFEEWVGGMDRLIMAVERADRMALEEPELPAPSADEQDGGVQDFLASGGGFKNEPASPAYSPPRNKRFDPTKTYKDPLAPPPAQVRRALSGFSREVQSRVAVIFERERLAEGEALRASRRPVYMSMAQILREAGVQDSSEDEAENGSPPDGPGKRALLVEAQEDGA